jgi:hypothetical protein
MTLIALSTLAASYVVESIVLSGAACTLIAIPALILAILAKRPWVVATCSLTVIAAIAFVVVELILFLYNANEAALGLCVIFMGIQAFTTVATLVDLRSRSLKNSSNAVALSIQSLFVAIAIFAVALVAVQNFPREDVPNISKWSVAFRYPWLPSVSLGMLLSMIYASFVTYFDFKREKTVVAG